MTFRGRVCDSQSASASMRSRPVVPRRSNLTPSELPEPGEERADGSLHASDCGSESLISVMLFPGLVSHWQPLVSFTYLFSWRPQRETWWYRGDEEVWIWNKILKNQLIWQQHQSLSQSFLFSFSARLSLVEHEKCRFCNRQAVLQNICYVFPLTPRPFCLISERLLGN